MANLSFPSAKWRRSSSSILTTIDQRFGEVVVYEIIVYINSLMALKLFSLLIRTIRDKWQPDPGSVLPVVFHL